MPRQPNRSPLEKKIQAEIELALGSEPDLLLLRNSVGEAVYFTAEAREYHVPYGLGVGSPDIVCILRWRWRSDDPLDHPRTVGIWLCLEVKSDTGKLEPEQEKCHAIWRQFGALVYVVRSVDEARFALVKARRLEC